MVGILFPVAELAPRPEAKTAANFEDL